MSNHFLETLRKRRTQYSLGKSLSLPNSDVTAVIQQAVRLAPSSFNSQSSRVIILFGSQSDILWEIVRETLRKIVPADSFASTDARIDGFTAGAGTVLFYEDQDVVRELQEKYALYADKFPEFSEQSAGMAQFAVWSALADAGIGASLQHYNPLIDQEVSKVWDVPLSWTLRAQMPFGSNDKPFPEKTFIDDERRFKVFS